MSVHQILAVHVLVVGVKLSLVLFVLSIEQLMRIGLGLRMEWKKVIAQMPQSNSIVELSKHYPSPRPIVHSQAEHDSHHDSVPTTDRTDHTVEL